VSLLLVMLGGAAGAIARYLVDRLMPAFVVPLATLTVNAAGSLLLGFLAGLGSTLPGTLAALIGVGFCGALTTWSTFAFQTVEAGSRRAAVLNVAVTLTIGFTAVVLGRAAGSG
jgi:CrcB protein